MAIKFGSCEWGLPITGPLAVTLAAELGYDGLQLADCGGAKMQYPLNNPRIQDAYLDAAAKGGVKFGSLHLRSVFQDNSIDEPAGTPLGELFYESVSKSIMAAVQMKIPEIMIAAIIKEKNKTMNLVENLRKVCEKANENGIILTVETNQDNEGNFYLFNEVGSGMKLCFDSCNPYLYDNGNPREMLEEDMKKMPGLISHYHFKDTRTEDFHAGRPAPCFMGTGGSDLKTQAEMIKKSGYDGWIYDETYYFARPINDGGDFMKIAGENIKDFRGLFE